MSKSKAPRRARKTRRPPRRRTGRAGAAAQNRNPQFEAIALTVDAGPRDELARVVDRVAKGARLAGWQGELVSVAEGQFELVPPPGGKRLTPGAAWDAVYRLRAQPEVVHAEPLFT